MINRNYCIFNGQNIMDSPNIDNQFVELIRNICLFGRSQQEASSAQSPSCTGISRAMPALKQISSLSGYTRSFSRNRVTRLSRKSVIGPATSSRSVRQKKSVSSRQAGDAESGGLLLCTSCKLGFCKSGGQLF